MSPIIRTPSQSEVPVYRRCPCCWNGNTGYGVSYSTQGLTRYYKCCKTKDTEKPPCGFTWTVTLDITTLDVVSVTHKIARIDSIR